VSTICTNIEATTDSSREGEVEVGVVITVVVI